MIETKIKEHDKFHHVPAFTLGFNGKMKYATIPGGIHYILSLCLQSLFGYQNLKE